MIILNWTYRMKDLTLSWENQLLSILDVHAWQIMTILEYQSVIFSLTAEITYFTLTLE